MTSQPSFDQSPSMRQPLSHRGADQPAALRAASALLATGGYALLAGGVFLAPFALSPYAIQNDVYMANLFLAPLFVLAGGIGALIGLLFLIRVTRARGPQGHMGRVGIRALLLAVAGAAMVAGASFIFGGRYESFGPVAISWPPYLNLPLLVFALVIGIVVCVVGWTWGASAANRAGQA